LDFVVVVVVVGTYQSGICHLTMTSFVF